MSANGSGRTNGSAVRKAGALVTATDSGANAGRTGRRFVVALVIVLTSLAVSLFVAFRQWRGRHEELAKYGAQRVAPAILPLADLVPPGFDAARWRAIVDQMRFVLSGLTGSGAMDLKDMQELRREIQLKVDASSRETAARTLEGLWAELERRAGPVLSDHPRLGLGSTVSALAREAPTGVDVESWRLAVLETRAMLVALGRSSDLTKDDRRQVRESIDARVRGASKENSAEVFRDVWDIVESGEAIPKPFAAPKLAQAARDD